jgi:hypothetical protein
VRTKVYVVVPPEVPRVDIDLVQISIDGPDRPPRPGQTAAMLPADPYDVAALLGEA